MALDVAKEAVLESTTNFCVFGLGVGLVVDCHSSVMLKRFMGGGP